MSAEDPTTRELRIKQAEHEAAAREEAGKLPDEDTAQFERRADKAAYLRRKLEERAEAERRAAQEDDAE